MSILGYNHQSSKINNVKKNSYCPLLFQKMLRVYEPVCRSSHHAKIAKKQSLPMALPPQERAIVDLNKKMKMGKARSHDESNKENMQDNGATFYDMSCEGQRKHSDILFSANQSRSASEGEKLGFLDIGEFMLDGAQNMRNQGEQQQQEKSLKVDGEEEPREVPINFELKQLQNELPDMVMPFKQLSKCEIIRQQPPVILAPKQQSSQKQTENEPHPQPHQVKTKISLRILRKRLQNHSLNQVVDDLVKNRRIQLDGEGTTSDKQAIYQAVLSLIKEEMIN